MYRLLILLIVFPLKLIGQETEVIKNTKVYLSPIESKDNVCLLYTSDAADEL